MPNFYVTFGQKSPFRDGWVLIIADDERLAREEAFYALGQVWSGLYTGREMEKIPPDTFKQGQLGRTLFAQSE